MAESRQEPAATPEWVWLALLLALCLFAVGPLMLPGYHWSAHDARHSVYFLFEFDRAFGDGVLYPRWAPDFTFGYGYPFFNIYGPLSSYLGEAFHLLGFDLTGAVKMVFGLSVLASALAMYLWLRLYSAPPGALLGALLYVYAPYHLADLYVRASLAEAVGLVFLPLCLWASGQLMGEGEHAGLPLPSDSVGADLGVRPVAPFARFGKGAGGVASLALAALAYAGLMLSSNPLSLLFTPILGGYVLVLAWARYREQGAGGTLRQRASRALRMLLRPAAALTLGLGLSAIFWLPAFLEYRFVREDQWVGGYYEFSNHFVSLFQLFRLTWGYGSSLPGPDDGMSFQLGLAPLTLSCWGLLSWPALSPAWRRATGFFLVLTLAIVFLMLPLSQPVWRLIGLVRFAQFPWRLLALTILTLAFLGASAFANWYDDGRAPLLAVLFALLIVLPVYPYLRAEIGPATEGEVSLAGLMRFQQSADEMTGSTAWVRDIPRWSPLADQIMSGIPITTKVDYTAAYGSGRLVPHSMAMGTTYEKVWFQAEDDAQRLVFHTFYYPGWTAYVLDEKTERVQARAPVEPLGALGLISVPLPRGRHILLLRFEDTPVRKLGTALTLASAAICLALAVVGVATGRRRV